MYHVRWWVKRLWWDRSWGFLPAKEQFTETVLYWTINVHVISSQPMGRNYNPVSGTVKNRVLYFHFKAAVTIEGTSLVLNLEGFPGASAVRNSPAVKERRVWSLGHKGPLEAKMATHSSVLAWEIPWREEPGRLWSMGSQELDMIERMSSSSSRSPSRFPFHDFLSHLFFPRSYCCWAVTSRHVSSCDFSFQRHIAWESIVCSGW